MAAAPVTARAAEPMLVWHLLTHTSGLTYGFQQANAVDEAYRAAGFFLDPPPEHDLASACDVWAGLPLLFEPGAEWNYSVSTDVLGRVIEVVSGQSLDEFFAERIFEPLGMTDTGFSVSDADRPRMTALYAHDPATATAVPYPGVDVISAERPKLLAGGHGLASTAADYHRFTQMLLRRGELDGVRLLAPRTVDLMTANHLPGNATLTEFGRPLLDLVINEGYGFGLGLVPARRPDRGQDAVGGRRVPLGGRGRDRVLGRSRRGDDRALLHPGALRLRRRLGRDAPARLSGARGHLAPQCG